MAAKPETRERGYFISGASWGGYKRSETVHVVYGEPIGPTWNQGNPVKFIEAAYEVTRYNEPDENGLVYITRHRVDDIVWNRQMESRRFLLNPTFESVFETALPKWERERKLYIRRNWAAFFRAIERAGFTRADIPRFPDPNTSTDAVMEEASRAYRQFLEKTLPYGRPPKPLLVSVVGLDEIFRSVKVSRKLVSV